MSDLAVDVEARFSCDEVHAMYIMLTRYAMYCLFIAVKIDNFQMTNTDIFFSSALKHKSMDAVLIKTISIRRF